MDRVQSRHIAVIEEAAECIRVAAVEAAREAAEVTEEAVVAAASFLSNDFSNSDEDFWEPGPFRTPPIVARVPLLPPLPGWGQGGFIPGRGFAQYPIHPALRAQAPVLRPRTPPAPQILP